LFAFAEKNLVSMIFGPVNTFSDHAAVSIAFGFVELLVAFAVDRLKLKVDYSFWIYLFGTLAFWGGWTLDYTQVYYTSQEFAFIYAAVNVVLLILAVPLNRIIFLIFGGFGFTGFVVNEMYLYGTVASNSWFSVGFGCILVVAAYIVDQKEENSDFPFWAYLFGVGTFECGLSTLFGWPIYTSQWFKLFYCVVNIGVALLYIPTQRDVFIFAGSIGVIWYAQELIETYAPSYAMPILLTVLGLALIGIAVYISTNKWLKSRRAAQSKNAKTDIEDSDLLL